MDVKTVARHRENQGSRDCDGSGRVMQEKGNVQEVSSGGMGWPQRGCSVAWLQRGDRTYREAACRPGRHGLGNKE